MRREHRGVFVPLDFASAFPKKPAHSFSPRMRCIRRDGLPPQRPRLFSTFRRDGLRLFSTSRYPPASAWDKLAPSGGMRTTRASHPRRRIIVASNAALIALTNHFRFVSQIPGIHALISNSSFLSIRLIFVNTPHFCQYDKIRVQKCRAEMGHGD